VRTVPTTAAMNIVEIDQITKSFGEKKAVADLSLQVPQGSIYGFIGPNGSGKTTTLRLIMNIFYPDRGEIRVFGEKLHGAACDRIGYLPEERGLYKRMRVREILRFYGGLKSGRDVSAEVDRWLEKLGLADSAQQKVETLSKGMSHRVQFIAAVVAQPELVILDEPFSGLDPVNVDSVRQAVLELRARGTTILLSTHDMSVAEKMCDFICMIFRGRKVLDGTLTSIQEAYGTDTIRLRADGGAEAARGIAGVEAVTDYGQVQELRLRRDHDPQEILGTLLRRTRIDSFEVTKPSLHDIFVRIAAPKETEVPHA